MLRRTLLNLGIGEYLPLIWQRNDVSRQKASVQTDDLKRVLWCALEAARVRKASLQEVEVRLPPIEYTDEEEVRGWWRQMGATYDFVLTTTAAMTMITFTQWVLPMEEKP